MVTLEPSLLIGKGLDRECYAHPDDPQKCIKITFSGDYKQEKDELNYYNRLSTRGIAWDYLARLYSVVETNRGRGVVYELIRDHTGSVSRNLSFYLSSALPEILPNLSEQLQLLKKYLLRHSIVVRDLKNDNLAVQKLSSSQFRLVIVDGIGNNDFLRLSEFIPPLTRRKILRKWNSFEQRLAKRFQKESLTAPKNS